MKKCILMLNLLACISSVIRASDYVSAHTPSDKEDVNKSCSPINCHDKREKAPCAATPISKAKTIKHSGCYCLTKDIKGTIVIAADDVSLDLNCHQIDAEGNANAVNAQGHTGVTIKNGSIVNSSAAGINLVSCEEVVVTDITFRNNVDISLNVQAELVGGAPDFTPVNPSQGIWVSNLDISQGNRAMLFRGCNELRIASCDVYENTNTIANAVVGVEHCNNVLLEEVFVNNNIKEVTDFGPLGLFSPTGAVLLVQASNNTQLKNCTTNNNFSEMGMAGLIVLGADIGAIPPFVFTGLSSGLVIEGHQSNSNTNTTGTASGIAINIVPNAIIRDSQSNGNVTTHASNGVGVFGTQNFLFGLIVSGSPRAYIKNHQSNQNMSKNATTGIGSEVFGIVLAPGLGIAGADSIIENCMANDNGDFEESSIAVGIQFAVGLNRALLSNGAIIRRCQTNGNKAHIAAVGTIANWNHTLVEDCQSDNNNSFGAPDPVNNGLLGFTTGFVVYNEISDVQFISCNASNNSCSNDIAAGIQAAVFTPLVPGKVPLNPTLPQNKIVIQDCVTNSNTGTVGYGVRLYGASESQVVDSTAIGNTVGFHDGEPVAMITASIAAGGPVTLAGSIAPSPDGTFGILSAGVPSSPLFAGQALSGGGILPGTVITSFVGGVPGGTGVYFVNIPQTTGPIPVITATTTSGVLSVAATSGPLFPGQTISGAGVASGTTITGYVTATGGLGDYVVNISQMVPSEPMTSTTPENSFFGNRAENNSTADFQNIPAGNTVVFDKAMATFVPTPPNRWSNVQIFPS